MRVFWKWGNENFNWSGLKLWNVSENRFFLVIKEQSDEMGFHLYGILLASNEWLEARTRRRSCSICVYLRKRLLSAILLCGSLAGPPVYSVEQRWRYWSYGWLHARRHNIMKSESREWLGMKTFEKSKNHEFLYWENFASDCACLHCIRCKISSFYTNSLDVTCKIQCTQMIKLKYFENKCVTLFSINMYGHYWIIMTRPLKNRPKSSCHDV